MPKLVRRIIVASIIASLCACTHAVHLPFAANQTVVGGIAGAGTGATIASLGSASTAFATGIGGAAGVIIGHDIRRKTPRFALIEQELMKGGVHFVRIGEDYKLVMPTDYFFYTDSPRLNHTGRYYLNEIAEYLRYFDITSIRVEGFTDNNGLPERNQALSYAQAQAVEAYLNKHNPDVRLISARGLGADDPIATNRTLRGRSMNRRVELSFRLVPYRAIH